MLRQKRVWGSWPTTGDNAGPTHSKRRSSGFRLGLTNAKTHAEVARIYAGVGKVNAVIAIHPCKFGGLWVFDNQSKLAPGCSE